MDDDHQARRQGAPVSRQQDIADTRQSWCWVGLGWTCIFLAPLTMTLEGVLFALSAGTAANMVGAYVGLRRYWRK